MNFFCVYTKNRKKFDKYVKSNKIKKKYIIDIKEILEDEDISFIEDKIYLKILIYNKIQKALEKNMDVYYLPDFDNDFSIEKLINLKKMLHGSTFNVLLFYNEFKNDPILDEAMSNLNIFDNTQMLEDY